MVYLIIIKKDNLLFNVKLLFTYSLDLRYESKTVNVSSANNIVTPLHVPPLICH